MVIYYDLHCTNNNYKNLIIKLLLLLLLLCKDNTHIAQI